MKLNIQVIFIFDGPGRPWKHGSNAGRVDYERTRLLIQLLDRLRIPHHRAPAEAEAECAMLQQSGIVDAVWSDDADSLMFGATMLIRDHRPEDAKKNENKKDIRLVDVFDAGRIKTLFGLTQASILLFVLLVLVSLIEQKQSNPEEETVLISYRTGRLWTCCGTRGNTVQR